MPPPTTRTELIQQALARLIKKDGYGFFQQPVSIEEVPDYHTIIKHPMDFSTMQTKLANGAYADVDAFAADFRLICDNACTYNEADNVFHKAARTLRREGGPMIDTLKRRIAELKVLHVEGASAATAAAPIRGMLPLITPDTDLDPKSLTATRKVLREAAARIPYAQPTCEKFSRRPREVVHGVVSTHVTFIPPMLNGRPLELTNEDYDPVEDVWVCCVCDVAESHDDVPLLQCSSATCGMVVHPRCYGVASIPTDDWYCDPCALGLETRHLRCALCSCTGGGLKPTDRGMRDGTTLDAIKAAAGSGGHIVPVAAYPPLQPLPRSKSHTAFRPAKQAPVVMCSPAATTATPSAPRDDSERVRNAAGSDTESDADRERPAQRAASEDDDAPAHSADGAHEHASMDVDAPPAVPAASTTSSGPIPIEWAHLVCAMYVPEVCIGDSGGMRPIYNLTNIYPRRAELQCRVCRSGGLAVIQCSRAGCGVPAHVQCARNAQFELTLAPDVKTGTPQHVMRCPKHDSRLPSDLTRVPFQERQAYTRAAARVGIMNPNDPAYHIHVQTQVLTAAVVVKPKTVKRTGETSAGTATGSSHARPKSSTAPPSKPPPPPRRAQVLPSTSSHVRSAELTDAEHALLAGIPVDPAAVAASLSTLDASAISAALAQLVATEAQDLTNYGSGSESDTDSVLGEPFPPPTDAWRFDAPPTIIEPEIPPAARVDAGEMRLVGGEDMEGDLHKKKPPKSKTKPVKAQQRPRGAAGGAKSRYPSRRTYGASLYPNGSGFFGEQHDPDAVTAATSTQSMSIAAPSAAHIWPVMEPYFKRRVHPIRAARLLAQYARFRSPPYRMKAWFTPPAPQSAAHHDTDTSLVKLLSLQDVAMPPVWKAYSRLRQRETSPRSALTAPGYRDFMTILSAALQRVGCTTPDDALTLGAELMDMSTVAMRSDRAAAVARSVPSAYMELLSTHTVMAALSFHPLLTMEALEGHLEDADAVIREQLLLTRAPISRFIPLMGSAAAGRSDAVSGGGTAALTDAAYTILREAIQQPESDDRAFSTADTTKLSPYNVVRMMQSVVVPTLYPSFVIDAGEELDCRVLHTAQYHYSMAGDRYRAVCATEATRDRDAIQVPLPPPVEFPRMLSRSAPADRLPRGRALPPVLNHPLATAAEDPAFHVPHPEVASPKRTSSIVDTSLLFGGWGDGDDFSELRPVHAPQVTASMRSLVEAARAAGFPPHVHFRFARPSDAFLLHTLNRVNDAYICAEDFAVTVRAKNEFVLVATRMQVPPDGGEPEEHIVAFVNYYMTWFTDRSRAVGERPSPVCVAYVATLQAVKASTHADVMLGRDAASLASPPRPGTTMSAIASPASRVVGHVASPSRDDATSGLAGPAAVKRMRRADADSGMESVMDMSDADFDVPMADATGSEAVASQLMSQISEATSNRMNDAGSESSPRARPRASNSARPLSQDIVVRAGMKRERAASVDGDAGSGDDAHPRAPQTAVAFARVVPAPGAPGSKTYYPFRARNPGADAHTGTLLLALALEHARCCGMLSALVDSTDAAVPYYVHVVGMAPLLPHPGRKYRPMHLALDVDAVAAIAARCTQPQPLAGMKRRRGAGEALIDALPLFASALHECIPITPEDEALSELHDMQCVLGALKLENDRLIAALLARVCAEDALVRHPTVTAARRAARRAWTVYTSVEKRRSELREEAKRAEEAQQDACCGVCGGADSMPKNQIIFCDKCNLAVHQACYGVVNIPSGEWFCAPCEAGLHPASVPCELCCVRGGPLRATAPPEMDSTRDASAATHTYARQWMHVLCARLAFPQLQFTNPTRDNAQYICGLHSVPWDSPSAPSRDWLQASQSPSPCCVCGSSAGVTLPCAVNACRGRVHGLCAADNGLIAHVPPSTTAVRLRNGEGRDLSQTRFIACATLPMHPDVFSMSLRAGAMVNTPDEQPGAGNGDVAVASAASAADIDDAAGIAAAMGVDVHESSARSRKMKMEQDVDLNTAYLSGGPSLTAPTGRTRLFVYCASHRVPIPGRLTQGAQALIEMIAEELRIEARGGADSGASDPAAGGVLHSLPAVVDVAAPAVVVPKKRGRPPKVRPPPLADAAATAGGALAELLSPQPTSATPVDELVVHGDDGSACGVDQPITTAERWLYRALRLATCTVQFEPRDMIDVVQPMTSDSAVTPLVRDISVEAQASSASAPRAKPAVTVTKKQPKPLSSAAVAKPVTTASVTVVPASVLAAATAAAAAAVAAARAAATAGSNIAATVAPAGRVVPPVLSHPARPAAETGSDSIVASADGGMPGSVPVAQHGASQRRMSLGSVAAAVKASDVAGDPATLVLDASVSPAMSDCAEDSLPVLPGVVTSDDVVCAVCGEPDSDEGNAIVFCDGCDVRVHQACYGITAVPAGAWLCEPCAVRVDSRDAACVLCTAKGGALKPVAGPRGEWAHVICALWVPETRFGNATTQSPVAGVNEIHADRWKLKCRVCKHAKRGAPIQCMEKACRNAYHVTCGLHARYYFSYGAGADDDAASVASSDVQRLTFCPKHTKPVHKHPLAPPLCHWEPEVASEREPATQPDGAREPPPASHVMAESQADDVMSGGDAAVQSHAVSDSVSRAVASAVARAASNVASAALPSPAASSSRIRITATRYPPILLHTCDASRPDFIPLIRVLVAFYSFRVNVGALASGHAVAEMFAEDEVVALQRGVITVPAAARRLRLAYGTDEAAARKRRKVDDSRGQVSAQIVGAGLPPNVSLSVVHDLVPGLTDEDDAGAYARRQALGPFSYYALDYAALFGPSANVDGPARAAQRRRAAERAAAAVAYAAARARARESGAAGAPPSKVHSTGRPPARAARGGGVDARRHQQQQQARASARPRRREHEVQADVALEEDATALPLLVNVVETDAQGHAISHAVAVDDTRYCVCRATYAENCSVMVGCGVCEEWFHVKCMQLRICPEHTPGYIPPPVDGGEETAPSALTCLIAPDGAHMDVRDTYVCPKCSGTRWGCGVSADVMDAAAADAGDDGSGMHDVVVTGSEGHGEVAVAHDGGGSAAAQHAWGTTELAPMED